MRKIEKPTIKHTTIVSKKEATVEADSPYGEIRWMDKEDIERLIYVEEDLFNSEGFKPPATWMTLTAFGGRMYYRARDRATAQKLCDSLHGKGKYTVVADKVISVR